MAKFTINAGQLSGEKNVEAAFFKKYDDFFYFFNREDSESLTDVVFALPAAAVHSIERSA